MTLFEKLAKKYHKSIIEVSFWHGFYRKYRLTMHTNIQKAAIFLTVTQPKQHECVKQTHKYSSALAMHMSTTSILPRLLASCTYSALSSIPHPSSMSGCLVCCKTPCVSL